VGALLVVLSAATLRDSKAASIFTPSDPLDLLVEPGSLAPLAHEPGFLRGASGERYTIEEGIVRMLRNVDSNLARELEAQDIALEEYTSPKLLMPRYERDMAELALVELFGGSPPRGTILDAGCGIGLLGSLYPDLGLIGLDASLTLLKEARRGYRLRVEASAEALPFRSGSFDVVVALNMLHHVINPERAVREFARLLRPGGSLVAVDPRKVLPIELAKRVLRSSDSAFAPTHKAFTVSEYEGIVRQSGLFEIARSERVGLASLVAMGGLDALKLSPYIRNPDFVVRLLRTTDRVLFGVPGVARAGLNLAVLAVRSELAVSAPA
jgi:SAM-dependent methyltransferase